MVETVIYSWWETTGQPNFENQIKFLRSKSGKVLRIDHTYKAVKSLGVSTPIKKKSVEQKTDSAHNADSGQDPSQKSDTTQKSDSHHQPNRKSKTKKKKPKYNWVNNYFWYYY